MKTSVELSPNILKRAKEYAKQRGVTSSSGTSLFLRRFLDDQPKSSSTFRLRDVSVGGQGVVPGLQEGEWDTVRDRIYEGRGS